MKDRRKSMKKSIKYSTALCALLPVMAMGADTWWNNAAVGNWEDAGNWGAGVPTASDRAIINTSADVATVNSAGAVANNIIANNGATLNISTGASLTVGEGHLGTSPGSTVVNVDGFLVLTGSGWFELGGGSGGATMNVNAGGSVTSSSGEFFIAGAQGGNLVLNGGTFTRAGWLHQGAGATGNITVNSGGFDIGVINTAAGSTADITINGGASIVGTLGWGNGGGAQTMNLNGGQLTISGGLIESAENTYNIGDGTLVFEGTDVATVDTIVSGANWTFADTKSVVDLGGGSVAVTSIPEPATLGLLAIFGGALVASRRRMFR